MTMDNHTSIAEASSLGNEFCKTIPSVQYLYFEYMYSTLITPSFCKSLVSGYVHKLKHITCPHWSLADIDRFSDRLTHVKIYKLLNVTIPKMFADSLESINLENVRNDLVWNSFECDNNQGILKFSNLNTLRLCAYVENREDVEGNLEWLYPASEFSYKLFAPKLEVTIYLFPHMMSILSSIQGLSVIKYVEFISGKLTINTTDFNLDKVRGLFSRYAKGNHESYKGVDMAIHINDILSIDYLTKHSKLRWWSNRGTFGVEQIYWKYLDALEMYFRFIITELPVLLSKLPSLETLEISKLELKTVDGSISEILDPGAAVKPTESEIKQITVYNRSSSWTDVVVNNLKEYLGKLLPNSRVIVEDVA